MFILLSILLVTLLLYHYRQLSIKDLVDLNSINSSNSLKVVILKRDTFLGEMLNHKEIINTKDSIKLINDLETYKLRRTIVNKGPDDVTQYFISVRDSGNEIIRLVVKGNNYVYLRDKRDVFDTYRILKNTYNTDLLETLLN